MESDSGSATDSACGALLDQKKHLQQEQQRRMRRRGQPWCPPWARVFCTVAGVVLVILLLILSSLGTYVMWTSDILGDTVNEMLILRNGSAALDSWRNPPVHALMRIRIFYTNLQAYMDGDAKKLLVEEVGPYVFREIMRKTDIKFGDNDTTITYRLNNTYIFVPEESNGTLNDTVMVLNSPLMTAFARVRDAGVLARLALRGAMRALNAQPFHRLTAQQLFWGYSDKLVNTIQNVVGPFNPSMRNLKVGLLQTKQGVSEDVWTVYSGAGDHGLSRLGYYAAYNGQPQVDYYWGDECNQIQGSDGSRFPPALVHPGGSVWVYLRETCRRTLLLYNTTVKVMNGIPGLRYTPQSPKRLAMGEEDCYCSEKDGCLPYALMDSSSCRNGAPIIVSVPHFMNADYDVRTAVDGLDPVPEKHESYLVIHEKMGVPIAGKSRFQFNIKVHATGGYRYMNPLEGTVLPIIWLERDIVEFPPDLQKILYFTAVTLDSLKAGLQHGLPVVAAVCALSLALFAAARCRKNRRLLSAAKRGSDKILLKVTAPSGREMTRL